jgi:hypothetical protein
VRHIHFRWLQAATLAALFLASSGAASGQGALPLSPFAAHKVSVLPVQFLRADNGAPVSTVDWTTFRKELDDSIGTAIAERGVGKKWAYAADVARMAKRNAGYVSDPYTLGAGSLRTRPLKPEEQAPRTVIDNMRSLIALGDSRYALVPVELAFARKDSAWVANLRLVLLDGRAGQVVWFVDLPMEVGSAFGSAGAGALAQRVADLVASR